MEKDEDVEELNKNIAINVQETDKQVTADKKLAASQNGGSRSNCASFWKMAVVKNVVHGNMYALVNCRD